MNAQTNDPARPYEAVLEEAVAHHRAGRLYKAEAIYRRVLGEMPDHPKALHLLGVVAQQKGYFKEAIELIERSIREDRRVPEFHSDLGEAYRAVGRYDDALAAYDRALAMAPDEAQIHVNHALGLLTLGRFADGFAEFEWRRRTKALPSRGFEQPPCDTVDLAGKTILLHWEQGLGDTIQYVRYARLLHDRGARVVVECQAPIKRLLQSVGGIDELVGHGEPLPAFDCYAPIASLPHLFGATVETIPAATPYIRAETALIEAWQARLDEWPGMRIGIAWQGNPKSMAERGRSIPLAQFAPLGEVPGVRLIVLQKHHGRDQLDAAHGDIPLIDLATELDTGDDGFIDTAALMMKLDLIITSDTSIAHLAGAMGRPVWVGLRKFADWRWLVDRDDSPWYPSMRLFRQAELDDWTSVFAAMAQALRKILAVRR